MKYLLIYILILISFQVKSQNFQIPCKSKLTPLDIKINPYPGFEGEIELKIILNKTGGVQIIYIDKIMSYDGAELSEERQNQIIDHYCSKIENFIFENKTGTIKLVVQCRKSI